MNRRGLDRDMIISLGVLSLITSISIIFFALFLLDINISLSNIGLISASFSTMAGAIWLVLLCRNC
ncbi:MAG: hypothetical protein K6F66_09170 [Pseudobutyrivibrio sp.]|nr:hypothetical protein [Pseudobutyrivibrio sp.]